MPRARAGKKNATYRDHAERYGKSLRTVKAWVALGKENGDAPPFDDPAAMIQWWTRNKSHRVPDSLWKAAGSEAMMEIPPAAEAAPVEEESVEEEGEEEMDESGELGLVAEVDALVKLARKLRNKAPKPGQTKPYLDTLARLGKLTADLRAEAEREGKLMPRDAVEAAIVSFHGPIEREIRLLYQTMCGCIGVPSSPEREAAWHAEVDRLFARFQQSLFAA